MKYNITLNSVIKEIKKEVIPSIPIKKFTIVNVKRKKNCLGYYKNGSCFDKTIIKLNIPTIKEAEKEGEVSLYDILLTTILHELAHAIQQLKNKFFNEEEAENFAYHYWDWKELLEI